MSSLFVVFLSRRIKRIFFLHYSVIDWQHDGNVNLFIIFPYLFWRFLNLQAACVATVINADNGTSIMS